MPSVPRDPMRGEQSRIPRLCVSPTLAGCVRALLSACYRPDAWCAYRVMGRPVDAIGVPDDHLTGERWFLIPIEATYAGCVASDLSAEGTHVWLSTSRGSCQSAHG